MLEPTIICPECKNEIKLTDSLAAPLIEATRREYEQRLTQKDAQVAERLQQERTKIVAEETKKAKLVMATDLDQKAKEITDLKDVLQQRDRKLADAQKVQAEFLRKQRALDDAKREMDLTIERRVQGGIGVVREQAKKEAEEALRLKVTEKEQTITSMQQQIEELKRRAEQGSQQLQGEVQELELEKLLHRRE